MDKVLVHCCCAPDALYCLKKLLDEGNYDPSAYFYNPNIYPEDEYRKRLGDMVRVARELGVPLVEGDYEPGKFTEFIAGHENELEGGYRCARCFDLRLGNTALYTKEHGFDAYTSTLTVSPHKSASLIRYFGMKNADEGSTEFIFIDFKKGGGFQESVRLSKEMGLYRQKYCGCEYSL